MKGLTAEQVTKLLCTLENLRRDAEVLVNECMEKDIAAEYIETGRESAFIETMNIIHNLIA